MDRSEVFGNQINTYFQISKYINKRNGNQMFNCQVDPQIPK